MKWLKALFKRLLRFSYGQVVDENPLVWYGDPRDKPKPIKLTPEQERACRDAFSEAIYHRPLRIRLHGGLRSGEMATISQQTRDRGVVPVLDPVGWEDIHEPTPEAVLTTTTYRRYPVGWTSDPDDPRQSRRHICDLWVADGEEPADHLSCVQKEFGLL